jgi:hypothetical protein
VIATIVRLQIKTSQVNVIATIILLYIGAFELVPAVRAIAADEGKGDMQASQRRQAAQIQWKGIGTFIGWFLLGYSYLGIV